MERSQIRVEANLLAGFLLLCKIGKCSNLYVSTHRAGAYRKRRGRIFASNVQIRCDICILRFREPLGCILGPTASTAMCTRAPACARAVRIGGGRMVDVGILLRANNDAYSRSTLSFVVLCLRPSHHYPPRLRGRCASLKHKPVGYQVSSFKLQGSCWIIQRV